MKRSLVFAIGTLVTIGLFINARQFASAGSLPKSQCPAYDPATKLEIPDDGNWLCVSWKDADAPADSIITEARLKFKVDHPAPDQVEVHLKRAAGSQVSQVLQKGGTTDLKTNEGQGFELRAFVGEPAQGEWQLWLRDLAPGQTGRLKSFSISVLYAPVEPLPAQIWGSPGRPTSLRIAPGLAESETPDAGEKPLGRETPEATLELTDGWQTIKSETFEWDFPGAGWEVLDDYPNDGKEYKWDDDDYRHHAGGWAAWPARGGTNGINPPPATYPPYMSSWMIYGPFDLSNAKTAEVSFWLWRQIEVNYDYLFFGVSHDRYSTFTGYRWDGTADWQEQRISLDGYLGDASVWIAWKFYSDGTVQYEGPWVDDVLIRKYVAGQVTAQGSFKYYDRLGQPSPAGVTRVYLYDQDPGGTNDQLETIITQSNGSFQFPPQENWDDDDPDPDPNNRRLDLYVVWETDVEDSPGSRRRVTNFDDWSYKWASETRTNVGSGTSDFYNYYPSSWQEALWIFQDLRRAWEYFRGNTSPQTDPGSATARWESGENCFPLYPGISPCSSFFWPYGSLSGIFIAHDDIGSEDTIIHELGHQYMYNVTEHFWYSIATWNDFVQCAIQSHDFFVSKTQLCAWTEGWGDFLPLVVNGSPPNGDPVYTDGTGRSVNLETPTWGDNNPLGDTVEGRVAGGLYDLLDTNNEGYDSASFGFDPIADLVVNSPVEDTFLQFWESWQAGGQNEHHAVRAIYQNTIDYNDAPMMSLPNRTVLQDFGWHHAIDLWEYSWDEESLDAELTWQLLYVSDSRCGVSLDGHWVNIAPQPGWLGGCNVSLRVDDSLEMADDSFQVSIVPVQERLYLPIILKQP